VRLSAYRFGGQVTLDVGRVKPEDASVAANPHVVAASPVNIMKHRSEEMIYATEVRREYSHAIKWEKDVVPVLLDDTELPKALAEYQMVDFRVFSGFVAAHEPSLSDVAKKSSSGALRGAAAGAAAGAAVGAFLSPFH
jgi:hypothetical protein